MINFSNIISLKDIRYTFDVDQNGMILKSLASSWVSTIFYRWATFDVRFLVLKMKSFSDFSEYDEVKQYFAIE